MKITKRNTIRQLLNRETVYSLADYSRKVSKKVGRNITKGAILNCLCRMQNEAQLQFEQRGRYIMRVVA